MSIPRPSPTQEEWAQHSVTHPWRVIIKNSHGEKLVGILHDTGSKELVVLCHGLQSSKERIPMVNLAAALEKEGISAFRFDFAGNGGLAGGNVALLYASMFNDVSKVVNISGRFNLERGIEGRLGKDFLQRIKQNGFIDVKNKRGKFEYCVTEESLRDRLSTDTHAACLLIHQDCRVLTVHGSMDKVVPVDDAMEFAKFISNHKLHIIEGADHEYTKHQDELASVVLNFVRDRDTSEQLPLQTRIRSIHSRL
ncbi:uncharacterized protein LOC132183786 isoform X2 [Corylus avellana]|uniref:uncharacterized protein LOC132183786 isoform X2 n=1 Tax=Corylus avellana TaxID=13451 RepID=UPI00286C754F|nr:uncharacterized protein LOC132183786 isoform X2 [Corylus avellana]